MIRTLPITGLHYTVIPEPQCRTFECDDFKRELAYKRHLLQHHTVTLTTRSVVVSRALPAGDGSIALVDKLLAG